MTPDTTATPPQTAVHTPPALRLRLATLARYVRPQTRALVAAAAISLVTAAFALAQPLLARSAVDSIGTDGITSALVVPAVILVAALITAALLSGAQAYLLQRTGEAVVRSARVELVDHLLRLPIAEFDRRRTGDLISRVGADTTLLRAVITSGLVDAVSGSVTALGALVLMAIVDPILLLITVVAVAIVLAGSSASLSRIRRLSRQAQEAVGEMTAGVERALGAVRTVRAARAEARESAAIATSIGTAFAAGIRLARVEALLGPIASIAIQGAFIAVLGIGGARVAAGTASVGDLVAFIVLLFLLIQPLASAIQAATAIQTGLGAIERIEEVLAIATEGQDGDDPTPAPPPSPGLVAGAPAVEFVDVGFTYADGTDVLRGVSFRAEAGVKTALVGPSGAGKSTVLALVERFYDATSGAVIVDGRDVETIAHETLRERIAYVEQDAPALAGTIRDNVLLGAPDTSDAAVLAALGAVNLLGIVERAPLGLDAPVGDDGVLLSGGERQRLAIARALVTRPSLLLLDEPTANLDAANEEALQVAIAAIGERTSVLVVAHRLSTVIDAQRIVVLDEGRVVGTGTHEELLRDSGVYRDLASRQLLA